MPGRAEAQWPVTAGPASLLACPVLLIAARAFPGRKSSRRRPGALTRGGWQTFNENKPVEVWVAAGRGKLMGSERLVCSCGAGEHGVSQASPPRSPGTPGIAPLPSSSWAEPRTHWNSYRAADLIVVWQMLGLRRVQTCPNHYDLSSHTSEELEGRLF